MGHSITSAHESILSIDLIYDYKMHHVYIIESHSGSWYVGYTQDIERRLSEHRGHKNISTSKEFGWDLIYYESYLHKMDALGREKFLKSGSGRRFIKKQIHHYLTEN